MGVRIMIGDVREKLAELPDESVHCVVTSPPYFGLRDYGTAAWDGGDPACDHTFKPDAGATSQRAGRAYQQGHPQRECSCGAVRTDKQIGLEETPAAFVAVMVEVFRDVRRVLRPDGTLWLNLGDSYNANQGAGFDTNQDGGARKKAAASPKANSGGLPPKNLLGIPWRVAFALQADGWYLRQDIIWAKPNPMPESVTDRCTNAHEYLFLLSKSARYYYDAEAIAEDAIYAGDLKRTNGNDGMAFNTDGNRTRDGFRRGVTVGETRNRRSVWTVATQPFSGCHFATFPPALIEPCIKAGCRAGGVVLDPFGGAGTTGLVADRLGRNAILIELNPEYAAIAERRIEGDSPLFANVTSLPVQVEPRDLCEASPPPPLELEGLGTGSPKTAPHLSPIATNGFLK